MSDKCFCHFNGYEVKDAAARKAASENKDAIAELKNETEVAKFYFPSLESGGYTGSSALATIGGKCVLLDCAPSVNWEPIRSYYSELYENGVFENIDYIVISHYHFDHIENLEPILDLFPHEGVKVYLPMNPEGYIMESDLTTEEEIAKIKNARRSLIETLERKGVEYMEVSQETTIHIVENFCDMTLFNSSPSDYLFYQQNSSEYNNFSMCALFKTGEIHSLFPGDIKKDAQRRIVNTRTLPKLFLYAIHHHGYENDDLLEYMDMIQPEHAVLTTDRSCLAEGWIDSFTANYATEKLYCSAYGESVFVANKVSGSALMGKTVEQSGWYNNYLTLYVDNEYHGSVHDGSEAHPFTSANEANMMIGNNRCLYAKIMLKATATPYEMVWMRNYQQTVVLEGYSEDGTKPKIGGLYISGCQDAIIKNVEISGEGYNSEGWAMVHVMTSNAVFSSCIINGKENNATTKYKGIQVRTGCDVYFADGEVKNCYHGITFYRFGKITTNNVAFSDCYYAYMLYSGDLMIRGEDTIENVNVYVGGSVGSGAQYEISTRKADSTFLQNVELNNDSAISLPYYQQGIGVCVAIGKTVYRLGTEAITQAVAE